MRKTEEKLPVGINDNKKKTNRIIGLEEIAKE